MVAVIIKVEAGNQADEMADAVRESAVITFTRVDGTTTSLTIGEVTIEG